MGLNNFILNCEKENKELYKSIEYYKNKNKRLEQQLKQRDEVIDKAITKLGRYADEMNNNGNAYAICVDLLYILKRYKGDNKWKYN